MGSALKNSWLNEEFNFNNDQDDFEKVSEESEKDEEDDKVKEK